MGQSTDRRIDLRSDTVTRPTPQMREAMAGADVGDDVLGDDPTVARLEQMLAGQLRKEAAVFLPSGTQANLVATLAHCERGDEYIVAQHAHTYRWEAGGAAVLGSVQPQPIEAEPDGTIDLGKVAANIKPDDLHFARSRLLALENTTHGKVLPLAYHEAAFLLTRDRGLALHLDGARLFNAAVALGVPVGEITQYTDTTSVCLSKGLGAPLGSVLVGSAETIAKARRWRKMLGGSMRQVGIVAAAGIHALEHHVERLADDHANAARLAQGLAATGVVSIEGGGAATNMVFVTVSSGKGVAYREFLADAGIVVSGDGPTFRMVLHLDVTAHDVEKVIERTREFATAGSVAA